jgi:hypothetical protein
MYKFNLLITLTLLPGPAFADELYEVIGSSLKFDNNRTCLLDKTPQYAIESYEKSAVMVSETEYVLTQELLHCKADRAVRVRSIPSKVGVLSDINISNGIYIALDFVSTRPFSYLAKIARIGSSKNLASINGAYVSGRKLNDLKKFAFGGSGEAGTSITSPSGRFVAPNGQVECTNDAYPGVRDIQKNRRVIAADDACAAFLNSHAFSNQSNQTNPTLRAN